MRFNPVRVSSSKHVNEFIRVRQRAAENRETFRLHQLQYRSRLLLSWRTIERQFEGAPHLRGHVAGVFRLQPFREKSGMLQNEAAVHQIQRLQRRGAAGPLAHPPRGGHPGLIPAIYGKKYASRIPNPVSAYRRFIL